MDLTKRQWSLDEYIETFVKHYKATADSFEPIEMKLGGTNYQLNFVQTPRILFYEDGAQRPLFVNRHLITNEQWWYYCADTGSDIPEQVAYDQKFINDTLRMPVVNISAIMVAEYYNWMNERYGFPVPYVISENDITPVCDGIGFLLPNIREMNWITSGLQEMTEAEISPYAWHRGNANGIMQPVGTEQKPYFNKFQRGTLYHDGTYAPESVGSLGPVGNCYWVCFDTSEEFPEIKEI
jgi:hypothetical protein